jgi:hypothetical protein
MTPLEHRNRSRWAAWIGQGLARVHYGLKVEPTWLEVSRFDIPISRLPRALDGFRIAHLSDFHCGRHVHASYVRAAVDMAQGQQPDLVALTGDFIHHGHRYIDTIADAVRGLSAPLGVYAVLGNHDYSVRNALGLRRHRHLHQAVARALALRGIRVLRNESVVVERDGARMHLVGLEDLWSRACDLEQAFADLDPSLPCIALAHHPRTIERLEQRRCDLMLSGHTHGGQIQWRRRRTDREHIPRRFKAGLYLYENTHVYVTRGVGFGTVRARYGVRPEVAVLTLRSPVAPHANLS